MFNKQISEGQFVYKTSSLALSLGVTKLKKNKKYNFGHTVLYYLSPLLASVFKNKCHSFRCEQI